MAEKKATIKEVALKAGVSASIVSFVLNNTPGRSIPEATRTKVYKAVDELGYQPNSIAQSMRTKKSMSIGLVSFWELANHVFNDILSGVSRVSAFYNYTILFCNPNKFKDEFNYLDYYKQQKIDGIIFISPYYFWNDFNETQHIEKIKECGMPAAIINAYTQDEGVNCLYIDYFNSAYIAAEYLLNLGHKRIWYMKHDEKATDIYQAAERLRGYQSCIMKNESMIENYDVFDEDSFGKLLDCIKKGTGPTGIVANQSRYAHKLMKVLVESGITVPGRISVIAANDTPYTPYLSPPLTSVRLPLIELGASATKLLIKEITGETAKSKLKFPNTIIERLSCRRING